MIAAKHWMAHVQQNLDMQESLHLVYPSSLIKLVCLDDLKEANSLHSTCSYADSLGKR